MYTVTKEFTFDLAHRLKDHSGKCKNIHGHTYKVQITISSLSLDRGGMVIDFSFISKIMKPIIAHFDHCILLEKNDEILSTLSEIDTSVIVIDFPPTAENMARMIYLELEETNQLYGENNPTIEKVKVYETPTSWAEYSK